MENLIKKYYDGILNQLRGEVDFINEIFKHNGLKGEGNESAIRNLITKFIPKKYGIGSGIVIDRDGNPSRQCDIVIYDNQNYPEILSMTSASVHLYPVDFVYATIEVKTTLDSKKSREAIENIISVRKLNFIEEKIRILPTEPIIEINDDTALFENISTSMPIGIVFSYRSVTKKFKTFSKWFSPKHEEDTKLWPNLVVCLDQGIIMKPGDKIRKDLIAHLGKNNTPVIVDKSQETQETQEFNGKIWTQFNNNSYPISEFKGQQYLIDQCKILVHFMLALDKFLNGKIISPTINFGKNYLQNDFKNFTDVTEYL